MEVSILCYGCAAAYARSLITDDTAIKLFKQAYDYGINFFDTGHSYGFAESRIGMALKAYPEINRKSIIISTKFGTRIIDGKYVHDVNPDWIRESVNISLQRMDIDYIDILYVHGPKIKDFTSDFFDCLNKLKQSGKVRAIGANSFDNDVLQYIADHKCLDVVMLDYNVVRQDREKMIDKLTNAGIGVVAGQAMAEGLFSKDLFSVKSKKDIWYLLRTFGRRTSRKLYFNARKYRFLNHIEGYDGSQIALKYVLDNKNVSSAAIGTVSFEHLKKNVEAAEIEIPVDILEKVKEHK